MTDPEFYVGYIPRAPAGLAIMVRRTALGLLALAAGTALLLVFAQRPFPASAFEFQNYKYFEGVLHERPYPRLDNYLLVAPGKHGASDLVAGLEGQSVRLKGSLIYRDGVKMIETLPGTIASFGPPASQPSPIDLGMVTLAGEIIDSKCYLGVMNPGSGKVHRDCAARCISGGIPPALIARDGSGESRTILLAAADGSPLGQRILDKVAEPVEVHGRLLRSGDTLILETEPASIRRLRE